MRSSRMLRRRVISFPPSWRICLRSKIVNNVVRPHSRPSSALALSLMDRSWLSDPRIHRPQELDGTGRHDGFVGLHPDATVNADLCPTLSPSPTRPIRFVLDDKLTLQHVAVSNVFVFLLPQTCLAERLFVVVVESDGIYRVFRPCSFEPSSAPPPSKEGSFARESIESSRSHGLDVEPPPQHQFRLWRAARRCSRFVVRDSTSG